MTDVVIVEIRSPEHVSAARRLVQARSVAIGLSTLEATKFVTALDAGVTSLRVDVVATVEVK